MSDSRRNAHPPTPTGVKDPAAISRLLEHAESLGIRFLNLEFTDVVGLAKCVTIPVEQLADCLTNGKWFDGSAIEGFARVAETDMYPAPRSQPPLRSFRGERMRWRVVGRAMGRAATRPG